MERKSELTKTLLGASFKELVLKHPIEKITIKMITDGAGVIRPTFYNYFQDKYEVMEWLLEQNVLNSSRELMENGMEREAIAILFHKIENDQEYYRRCFQMTGQNSFQEILKEKIESLFLQTLKSHPSKLENFHMKLLIPEILARYYSIILVIGIHEWITSEYYDQITAEDAIEFYHYIVTHNITDIIRN